MDVAPSAVPENVSAEMHAALNSESVFLHIFGSDLQFSGSLPVALCWLQKMLELIGLTKDAQTHLKEITLKWVKRKKCSSHSLQLIIPMPLELMHSCALISVSARELHLIHGIRLTKQYQKLNTTSINELGTPTLPNSKENQFSIEVLYTQVKILL